MNRTQQLAVVVALALTTSVVDADGRIAVGSGHVSDDAFRYGRYSGLVDEGNEAWLDLDWRGIDWSVSARDIGLDTIDIRAEYQPDGPGMLSAAFRRIPHYRFDGGRTPFRAAAPNTLVLPAAWIAGDDTTGGMTGLEGALGPVSFRHERTIVELGYQHRLSQRLKFTFSLDHEMRDGATPLGAMIGSNGGNARAAIVPATLDASTTNFNTTLHYNADRTAGGLQWTLSRFDNDAGPLVWQNPFGQQAQWAAGVAWPGGRGQLAADPDNRFAQLRAFGSHVISSKARLNASVSRGWMRQDETFLPYTINQSLAAPEPLPANDANGRLDTLAMNLALVVQPSRRSRMTLRYRLDDRDNGTDRLSFRPVPGDAVGQVGSGDAELNRPYGYRDESLALDASFRATQSVTIQAGFKVADTGRDFWEVNDTTERTSTLGVSWQAAPRLRLSGDIEYADRQGETYVGNRPLLLAHPPGTVGADEFENHPLLRRYYLADFDRGIARLRADWFASDDLDLGASVSSNRFDYGDTGFGLNRTASVSLAIDAHFRPHAWLEIFGFVARDQYDQAQSGRAFSARPGESADDPDRNWYLEPEDAFVTANVSIEAHDLQQHFERLQGQLDAGLDLSLSRTQSAMGVAAATALEVVPLPDERTTVMTFEAYARYSLSARGSLRLSIARERYRGEDLALQGVAPDTMARVLSLGEARHDYAVTWIGLRYAYEFGRGQL